MHRAFVFSGARIDAIRTRSRFATSRARARHSRALVDRDENRASIARVVVEAATQRRQRDGPASARI